MNYEIESALDLYVDSHISPEPEHLARLTRESNLRLINGRMCSGHLQGRLLKMLTMLCNPKIAVELGTFTGYSALCIAEGLPEDATLITIEADDELEDFIRRQIDSSEHGGKIDLKIGKALEICSGFADESVDMVFIDADKREYPDYLKEAIRIIKPGGLIIADNTLWSGHVCDPAYEKDPQTRGVREFNDISAGLKGFDTVILPFRDGITLLRKCAILSPS
ncbi:MAG: O-methyltransferase [Muribaculaceae bacterium]|nr:O-methyltransferase [Muribaculaceae bacterium]